MDKKKQVSKKKVAPKKAATSKAAPKKQAEGKLTSRETILKHCEVKKERGQAGDTLIFGKHRYRMNKLLADHSDAECDRILKNMEKNLNFGAYIERVKKGAVSAARRKIVASVESKPCECGCKVLTRKGSRFLPGHDMKLKSKLRNAVKKGNANAKAKAQKELKARGW